MTELQSCIKQNPSADDGINDYIAEVSERFQKRPSPERGHRSEVKCRWLLSYSSRTNTVVTILFLPIMMLAGHAAARVKEVSFVTYHYLEAPDLRRLKRRRALKKLLLPCALIAMGITGMCGVISLIMVWVTIYPPAQLPGQPEQPPTPLWAMLLVVLGIGVLFAGSIMAQRRVWKLGEPQDSDCFRDQRIQLREVTVT